MSTRPATRSTSSSSSNDGQDSSNSVPEPLNFDIVHKIEQQGERQLDLALKSVDPLKDVNFYTFVTQLTREKNHRKWPSWIFDREKKSPTAQELQDLSNRADYDVKALKDLTAINNAYILLSRRCDNTVVASVLEGCTHGDVATAFNSVWDYHYPRTQAGIQRAYKNFNAATMANSHTTIVEWAAHVGRLATILRTTVGPQTKQLSSACFSKAFFLSLKA